MSYIDYGINAGIAQDHRKVAMLKQQLQEHDYRVDKIMKSNTMPIYLMGDEESHWLEEMNQIRRELVQSIDLLDKRLPNG